MTLSPTTLQALENDEEVAASAIENMARVVAATLQAQDEGVVCIRRSQANGVCGWPESLHGEGRVVRHSFQPGLVVPVEG